ncbi:MAG: hypothetical protein GX128_04115 [Bacteroidales bacterium]|jgi:hypothetical protein|nr:hypothetical protein [Bacteroidales bacterium]
MLFKYPLAYFLLIIAIFTFCNEKHPELFDLSDKKSVIDNCAEGVNELRPGDILVRPNLNFLPGSAIVPGGSGFGHAAIVISYYNHDNPDSLLANTTIIESIAKDVPVAYQIREIKALANSRVLAFRNQNFDNRYSGNRYRLRLNLPQSTIDSIIEFTRSQKGKASAWNAAKRFEGHLYANELVNNGLRKDWSDNTHWYCSLLVWQAVLKYTGIDLDPNGRYMVYPNDLIASPVFDSIGGDFIGRARF